MQAMRATPGPLPTGPGWAYEMSWDGPRLQVDVTRERVIARDDDGHDVTLQLPELLTMTAGLDDALFDGYLVSVGDAPVSFVISDLLRLYGVGLCPRSYRERRRSLTRLAESHPLLTISPSFDDADAMVLAARHHGLAGVIAKRWESAYSPATRSPEWIEHRFT